MKRLAVAVLMFLAVGAVGQERPDRPLRPGEMRLESHGGGMVRIPSEMLSAIPRSTFLPESLGCIGADAVCGGSRSGTTSSCGNGGEYYFAFHPFRGQSGQTLSVTVTSGVTAYSILVAIQRVSTGTILVSDYKVGRVTISHTFTSTDDYVVSIGFVAKYYTGSYTATFTCGTSGGDGQCRSAGTLQRGVLVTSTLGASDVACSSEGTRPYKLFEFQAEAGVPVRVTVDSSAFTEYAEAASDGDNAGTWWMSGAFDRFMIFYPTRTGLQNVWVSNDTGSTSAGGNFSIRIDNEPLESCKRRAARH